MKAMKIRMETSPARRESEEVMAAYTRRSLVPLPLAGRG
jgi:hypothetical protein